MINEIVSTQTIAGWINGTSGFCPVAVSERLPKRLVKALVKSAKRQVVEVNNLREQTNDFYSHCLWIRRRTEESFCGAMINRPGLSKPEILATDRQNFPGSQERLVITPLSYIRGRSLQKIFFDRGRSAEPNATRSQNNYHESL